MASSGVRFVPNLAGFDSVRRLPKLKVLLNERAALLAKACNDDFVASHEAHNPKWVNGDSKEGYRTGEWHGLTRYRASVITATQHAINDNSRDKTLIRHLGVLRF